MSGGCGVIDMGGYEGGRGAIYMGGAAGGGILLYIWVIVGAASDKAGGAHWAISSGYFVSRGKHKGLCSGRLVEQGVRLIRSGGGGVRVPKLTARFYNKGC